MARMTLTNDAERLVDAESFPVPAVVVARVKDLLGESKLPRSARWLRNRLEGEATLRVNSALHQLEKACEIEYCRNGTWCVVGLKEKYEGRSFDPMTLIGPVWEPRVVDALVKAGLPVIQQMHELSYYLDIAVMCANGAKLNVEVDGRTHRRFDGRRRISDIIRDAQLRSRGWTIHRVWVKDLMFDFDAQVEKIVKRWEIMNGSN